MHVGRSLGQFDVTALLGKGGMGEVYRALDTKLGREVAIKVLPETLAQDKDRLARFRQEARVLASLDHPNIGALYDFQEAGGVHFLVMQLVEGETLEDRLTRGPMPLQDALPLFIQIAEALEAAHAAEIVHRDLKPANVKISPSGKVKVLDFGLARGVKKAPLDISHAQTQENGDTPWVMTEKGAIVGTPAYMSPEQARGKNVDKHADVWAFGCCLYEALTGRRPFKGDTAADLLASTLSQEPDWRYLPRELPESIGNLLRRCLEKDPHRRLGSVGDIAILLEETREALKRDSAAVPRIAQLPGTREAPMLRMFKGAMLAALLGVLGFLALPWITGGPLAGKPPSRPAISSLAVLPFDNYTGDAEQEYFADGMTDHLTAELAKIGALKVIARTSAMQFKNTNKPIRQIARELDVDVLVEGSVFRSGQEVRITAQLVRGDTEAHLWSHSYTGTMANIIELQRDMALSIAREIEVTLAPEEEARIAEVAPVSPEAYDKFMLGMSHVNKYDEAGFRKGAGLLLDAINLDPNYAPAHAWLSVVNWVPTIWGLHQPEDGFKPARHFAQNAIRLDESLAMGHVTTGWIAMAYDWDWQKTKSSFERALELNPNEPEAYHGLAWYYFVTGEYDEAIDTQLKATSLDPLRPILRTNLATLYRLSGNADESEKQYDNVIDRFPLFPPALEERAQLLVQKGEYAEAESTIRSLIGPTGSGQGHGAHPTWVANLARIYSLSHRTDEADALIQGLLDGGEYVPPYRLASYYETAGDAEKALDYLERAYDERAFHMLLLNSPVLFEALRSNPRFELLVERMDFPPRPPDHPFRSE